MNDRASMIRRLQSLPAESLFDQLRIDSSEDPLMLVDIAATEESMEVRKLALIALDRHAELDFSVLHRLLELTDGSTRDMEPEVLTRAVRLLARHGTSRLVKQCTRRLEYILWHNQSREVRRATFRALEILGEMDVAERLCMLPCLEPEDAEAVMGVIGALLRKRRWIRAMNPSNFEQLVARVLESRHPEVAWRVVGRVRDHGVDIEGRLAVGNRVRSDAPAQILVQCKNRRSVSTTHMRDFVQKSSGHPGQPFRWFITSAPYRHDVDALGRSEHVCTTFAPELQEWLDEHAPGTYRIHWRAPGKAAGPR